MARTSDPSGKTGSEDLARIVRERREELGLSRQELADATGIPYPTIAQIETAYRGVSPSRLGLIARVLRLDPKDLYDVLASEGVVDAAASAAAPASATGSWHVNPRFAAGRPAPMAAAIPPSQAAPAEAVPADAVPPRGRTRKGRDRTAKVVEEVVDLLSGLPAERRIEALGQVQSRLLDGIVEERARKG